MKNSMSETEIRASSLFECFQASCSINIGLSLPESLCFIHWHLSASGKTYQVFPQADSCNKSDDQSSVDTGLAPALGISFFRLCWHHGFWRWAWPCRENCASHLPPSEGYHWGNPARSKHLAIWKKNNWVNGNIPAKAGLTVGYCLHKYTTFCTLNNYCNYHVIKEHHNMYK